MQVYRQRTGCASPKLHPDIAMTDLRVWRQCWYGFSVGGRGGWRSRISLKTLKSRRQRARGHTPPADSLQVKGQFQNQRSCRQIVTMMQASEPGLRACLGHQHGGGRVCERQCLGRNDLCDQRECGGQQCAVRRGGHPRCQGRTGLGIKQLLWDCR